MSIVFHYCTATLSKAISIPQEDLDVPCKHVIDDVECLLTMLLTYRSGEIKML